jgi:hypothetical protein
MAKIFEKLIFGGLHEKHAVQGYKQFFFCCITWLSLGPRREHITLMPLFNKGLCLQNHYLATILRGIFSTRDTK